MHFAYQYLNADAFTYEINEEKFEEENDKPA